MAFDDLMFIPKPEIELTRDVVIEVQRNFMAYRGLFYFIKLEECKNNTSQIVWLKTFTDFNSFEDFYFDTIMQRCFIHVGSKRLGYFEVSTFGFKLWQDLEVYPNNTVEVRRGEAAGNIETDSMPTREQFAAMMEQLTGVMRSKKAGAKL